MQTYNFTERQIEEILSAVSHFKDVTSFKKLPETVGEMFHQAMHSDCFDDANLAREMYYAKLDIADFVDSLKEVVEERPVSE